MNKEIKAYNVKQISADNEICDLLATTINNELTEAESKIWHARPVWFLDGNPIVGYNKLKNSIQLLFWSGQTFEEEKLKKVGNFKAAEFRYTLPNQVDLIDLSRWVKKSRKIQWDYKNIVKKGTVRKV